MPLQLLSVADFDAEQVLTEAGIPFEVSSVGCGSTEYELADPADMPKAIAALTQAFVASLTPFSPEEFEEQFPDHPLEVTPVKAAALLARPGEGVEETLERVEKSEFDKFVAYVLSFYGPSGIYPMNATTDQARKAAQILKLRQRGRMAYDSIEREMVRDIMAAVFGLAEAPKNDQPRPAREQELELFVQCVKQWADWKQKRVMTLNGHFAVECGGYNDIADLYFYIGCVISDGDTSFKTPDMIVDHGFSCWWPEIKQ